MRKPFRPRWGGLAGVGLAMAAASSCAGGYVAVESAPPPERVEVVEQAPGPGYVWVAGFWDWSGADYVWVPGGWAVPPHGRHVWIHDSWDRRGNRWRHARGRWE
jgi:hypothetical protein